MVFSEDMARLIPSDRDFFLLKTMNYESAPQLLFATRADLFIPTTLRLLLLTLIPWFLSLFRGVANTLIQESPYSLLSFISLDIISVGRNKL